MQCPEVDLVLSSAEFWTCLEHIHNNYSTLTGIKVSQLSSTLTTPTDSITTTPATTTSTSSTATAASYSSIDDTPSLTTAPTISSTTLHPSTSSDSDSTTTAYDRTSAFIHSLPSEPPHGRDPLEALLRAFSAEGTRLVHAVEANSGSGGYLEYIARYMATYLNSRKLTDSELNTDTSSSNYNSNSTNNNSNNEHIYTQSLPYIQGRNTDIAEIDLSSLVHYTLGSPLKFNKIYGFRNIQSIILKLKRNKCDISFIEVMACPSGCINGKVICVI